VELQLLLRPVRLCPKSFDPRDERGWEELETKTKVRRSSRIALRLKSEQQLICLFGLIVYEVVNPYTDRTEEWIRTNDHKVTSVNPEAVGLSVNT